MQTSLHGTVNLTAVLITLNEEQNIRDCLASVAWADEIVVLDSGSTDKTVEIAAGLGASVSSAPFTNFANQKNEAVSRARGKWILLVDADERVTPELEAEIKSTVKGAADAVYEVGRKTYFFGRRLRFSGTQSDYPIRLFPRENARFVQPVHECIETKLPVKRMKHSLIHYSTRDMAQYRRKMNQYVAFEVEIMAARGKKAGRAAPLARSIMKFVFLYFYRLGILDGLAGLQFAALSSFYDYSKYHQYRQKLVNRTPSASRI